MCRKTHGLSREIWATSEVKNINAANVKMPKEAIIPTVKGGGREGMSSKQSKIPRRKLRF